MRNTLKYLLFICCVTAAPLGWSQSGKIKSPAEYVDPFIGTAGHGHTFPGATVPFGLVQLSPDTDDAGWDWCSGYHHGDSTIMGFSHTHLSGTGISDLADILVAPFTGKIQLIPGPKDGSGEGYRSAFSHAEEEARPGYYAVRLKTFDIRAELTASHDMGMHRYTFPRTDSAHIMIDLLHGLDRHRSWLTERVLESALQVVDSVTVTGYRISSGWANVQPVYFQIRFSRPFTSCGMALHDVFRPQAKLMSGRNVKGVFTFSTQDREVVEMAVRLSDQPFHDTLFSVPSFESVRNAADQHWTEELSRVDIDAPDSILTIFYTALYHSAIAPNRLHSSVQDTATIRNHYEQEMGTLSQWDTYRAAFALNALLRPRVTEGIVGTLLRSADRNGYLPVWKLWHDDVHCMIGTPSVPILVEAVEKGYGLERLPEIKKAIQLTMANDNPVAPWSLFDRFGYIPSNSGEQFSVSKTLEMAYAAACARDFMARWYPGEKELVDLYARRAMAYRNVFDTNTGFFRGRLEDGSWAEPFDPTVTREDSFVEATPWQYLFHVQHDVKGLMALLGGRESFVARLDALFEAPKGKVDDHILDITGLIGQYAHGNEPSHHVAYFYNDAGLPWKTQERVFDIATRMYTMGPTGLCGNEDCGQMSAWYIFSALGMYPVHPSAGMYYLGVPLVRKASWKTVTGKVVHFVVHSPETKYETSAAAPLKYVREVRYNGQRLSRPVLSHDQLVEGGTIEFYLSAAPVVEAFSGK